MTERVTLEGGARALQFAVCDTHTHTHTPNCSGTVVHGSRQQGARHVGRWLVMVLHADVASPWLAHVDLRLPTCSCTAAAVLLPGHRLTTRAWSRLLRQ